MIQRNTISRMQQVLRRDKVTGWSMQVAELVKGRTIAIAPLFYEHVLNQTMEVRHSSIDEAASGCHLFTNIS